MSAKTKTGQLLVVAMAICAVWAGIASGDVTIADDQAEDYALISGTVAFASELYGWTADVDYAVYAPGEYQGTHVNKDTNYIYAYQIFNDPGTMTLSHLSIGLEENAGAASPGYDSTYGVSGGVVPVLSWLVGTPPTSVQWVDGVAPSAHSTVLLFSSPYTYTFEPATLANGGEGDTQSMPTPIPEPATMCLLVLGGIGVLIRRRRK